ncbi:MAG: radical SAM protein [Thermoproteota archaeon]
MPHMDKLRVSKPISAGIILSYRCNSACKHCMYACSPFWSADWFSKEGLRLVLSKIAKEIQPSPYGPKGVSINYGLHFTGGEPFLNFDLLLDAVKIANELKVPSTFVETNCFWCTDDEDTKEKLTVLKDAGLNGILISVNPFILECVPFERTKRAVEISRKVFGNNVMLYQKVFYNQFKELEIKSTLFLNQYLCKGESMLQHAELLLMGRACYKLQNLFVKYPAKAFFGESCALELTRNWHVHIDNYFNYMTGYCGGISLGDFRDERIFSEGIDLNERPIVRMLVTDINELYTFALREFNYVERKEGYISKCHLCIDIRRHLVRQTNKFKELQPRELYDHLEDSIIST